MQVGSALAYRGIPLQAAYCGAKHAIQGFTESLRCELSVGMSTVAAIWVDKIASGLMDRYLARTGYDAQQTDRPADPDRRDNLWKPLPGDYGAHGRFADRNASFSSQTWVNERLPLVLGIVFGAMA